MLQHYFFKNVSTNYGPLHFVGTIHGGIKLTDMDLFIREITAVAGERGLVACLDGKAEVEPMTEAEYVEFCSQWRTNDIAAAM
tara:strand:+ start:1248 stop:1496 length:249 start_codon:yes stop_codon:yes gene_type:complete